MNELGNAEVQELQQLLERISEAREVVRRLLASTGE
jgi:hypothetical protein